MGNDLDLAGSQDGCKDCQRQKTAISAILCNSTGNLMPKHLHRAGAARPVGEKPVTFAGLLCVRLMQLQLRNGTA
jgi:hypothetical protein